MNVFGVDLLQLIIYICVATSLIVVIYILKLTRSKKKTKTEPAENEPEQLLSEDTSDKTIITRLITLIDKMYSHQVGLTPTSSSNPNPELERQTQEKPTAKTKQEEPEPTQAPPLSLSHVDEETYKPTTEDQELLEKFRKLLKEKE